MKTWYVVKNLALDKIYNYCLKLYSLWFIFYEMKLKKKNMYFSAVYMLPYWLPLSQKLIQCDKMNGNERS